MIWAPLQGNEVSEKMQGLKSSWGRRLWWNSKWGKCSCTVLKACTRGAPKDHSQGKMMSVLFSDENNTHQCPSNEFMYDIWERITTKCNGYRWSRVGGECKKVWESFCLRFEGGEEKEEDTMLCWNIQRKRLLTQVKAPRGLILVFIRHHTKRREKHTNHKKLIIAAVTRLQCHSQNESICHILVYGYALELCMCECMCAGG